MRFRLSTPLGTMVLLALGVLAPGTTPADTISQFFGDDLHTSTTNVLASPGQFAAITTGMNNFVNANPANGSGPSGQQWSYTWANAAMVAKVEAGITVLNYSPFVVTPPAFTDAAGNNFAAGAAGELGGALINLKYTPQAGAPAFTNLHWVQAYSGTRRGNAVPALLDNDPAGPYMTQRSDNPFYDTFYDAGTLAGGGGYFADRPLVNELEYEMNPVASINFAVVLADDVQTVVDGVTQNAVTLYGGESWGFTYAAMDFPSIPEPSSYLLVTIGGISVVVARRLRSRRLLAA